MRIASGLLIGILAVGGFAAQSKAKAKPASASDLKAQLKKVTQERDDLQAKLDGLSSIQQDLAEAKNAQTQAESKVQSLTAQLEQLKRSLNEDKGSGDQLLGDLRNCRDDLAKAQAELEIVKKANSDLLAKRSPVEQDGLAVGSEVVAARPLNLSRVTPRIKGGFFNNPKGIVVVNVLINEKGEVVASRMIQPLDIGDAEMLKNTNDACLEAAKRLVFDPATTKDGKIKLKVWQPVGFKLD